MQLIRARFGFLLSLYLLILFASSFFAYASASIRRVPPAAFISSFTSIKGLLRLVDNTKRSSFAVVIGSSMLGGKQVTKSRVGYNSHSVQALNVGSDAETTTSRAFSPSSSVLITEEPARVQAALLIVDSDDKVVEEEETKVYAASREEEKPVKDIENLKPAKYKFTTEDCRTGAYGGKAVKDAVEKLRAGGELNAEELAAVNKMKATKRAIARNAAKKQKEIAAEIGIDNAFGLRFAGLTSEERRKGMTVEDINEKITQKLNENGMKGSEKQKELAANIGVDNACGLIVAGLWSEERRKGMTVEDIDEKIAQAIREYGYGGKDVQDAVEKLRAGGELNAEELAAVNKMRAIRRANAKQQVRSFDPRKSGSKRASVKRCIERGQELFAHSHYAWRWQDTDGRFRWFKKAARKSKNPGAYVKGDWLVSDWVIGRRQESVADVFRKYNSDTRFLDEKEMELKIEKAKQGIYW